MRIVVSGMIAADPNQGGATWAVLQYLLGFKRLGHDVLFIEQCAESKLVPAGASPAGSEGVSMARSENGSYFQRVMAEHGLERSSALLLEGTQETVGLPYPRLAELAADADLLVNISGILTDERLVSHIPVRAYLDLDPAFNQFWQASGIDMRFEGHTHFLTVGQAIGSPDCPIATCGFEWIPTVPPVVLEQWPLATQIAHDALTTVGNWRAYGSIEHGGVNYGQKVHSLREFVTLPTRTDARFLLALTIHPDETKDLEALSQNGWELVDAGRVAGTPSDYRSFLSGSRAELGITKSGYVLSRSGWFSDRSVCYLAAGRPVIAQETGFSRFLPTGEGLLPFETEDDAVAAIGELESNYERHSAAARALAEEHFDSDAVLTALLAKVGLGS
jgi:hypothetical protein